VQKADTITPAKAKEWEVYSTQLQELKKSGRAAYSNEEKREKAVIARRRLPLIT
jgi:hypothetical protein